MNTPIEHCSGRRGCGVWCRANGFHILRLICMSAIIQLCTMRTCLIRCVTTNHRKFIRDPLHADNDTIRSRLLPRTGIVSNGVQGTYFHLSSRALRIANMVHTVFLFFCRLKITLRTWHQQHVIRMNANFPECAPAFSSSMTYHWMNVVAKHGWGMGHARAFKKIYIFAAGNSSGCCCFGFHGFPRKLAIVTVGSWGNLTPSANECWCENIWRETKMRMAL